MTSPGERGRSRGPWAAALEAVLAMLIGTVLALAVRRPHDLSTTITHDDGDPLLNSWILSWPAHALRSGERLWDANTFAPLDNSFAFTDSLLGYLPFGLVGSGPSAALVRYNVVVLFTFALAFAGTWVLVRQLGLGRAAALVAATAFAFSPWRASQLGHVQVLSTGAIPLTLAMLARGHGIALRCGSRRPRPLWAYVGWATAAWQLSLGFAIGLQMAYVLAVCAVAATVRVVVGLLRGGRLPDPALVVANGAGLVLFLGVAVVLAQPYFDVVEDHPQSRRTVAQLEAYSPDPLGLVTAPPDSWLWGSVTGPLREGVEAVNEKELWPGLVVVGLAVIGSVRGPWSRQRRIVLLGTTVTLALLALGTNGPFGGRGYLLLYDYAPGYQGVRTPGRLVTTAWLALALLAAHGATVLLRQRSLLRRVDRSTAAAALAAVVLLEGLDTAVQVPVARPPAVAPADVPGPVLVLPSDQRADILIMHWSTDRFPEVVNGYSSFQPRFQAELRRAAARLPAPDALSLLRAAGVRSLLLLDDRLVGTRYERLDVEALDRVPGVSVQRRGEVTVVELGR